MIISDATKLKVVQDIKSSLSRTKYEEMLIESGLFSYDAFQGQDGEYVDMSYRDLIWKTLDESVLETLYENRRQAFSRESLDALHDEGIELEQEPQEQSLRSNMTSGNALSLPDYKHRALESHRAQLIEEFEAANTQLSRALSDVERLRLRRTADDLERQIGEIDVQLQGAPASEPLSTANPPTPEPPALVMARRALALLETQAGAYAASAIPVHLQLDLEEKRKQVEDLEARWRAGKL